MKSYYSLMQTGADDYSDALTLPTEKFVFSQIPLKVSLTEKDIERFDLLIANTYQTSEYYDLILDINNIGHIKDVDIGTEILLPIRHDLETFYQNYKAV